MGTVGALTFDESVDHMLATPSLYGADFDAKVFEAVSNDELTVAAELAADPDIEGVATLWTSGSADNESTMFGYITAASTSTGRSSETKKEHINGTPTGRRSP